MTNVRVRVVLLATILAAIAAPALAATPAPASSPKTTTIALPQTALHTEYVVEVNTKGQVVRVKSSKVSKSQTFNVQTFGNALQMWIRKADGTATVGLFKVTYDYDPKTKIVHRGDPQLVSVGGNWANEPGAATVMMDTARKEAQQAQQKAHPSGSSLPSLNDITGKPSPSASPH